MFFVLIIFTGTGTNEQDMSKSSFLLQHFSTTLSMYNCYRSELLTRSLSMKHPVFLFEKKLYSYINLFQDLMCALIYIQRTVFSVCPSLPPPVQESCQYKGVSPGGLEANPGLELSPCQQSLQDWGLI